MCDSALVWYQFTRPWHRSLFVIMGRVEMLKEDLNMNMGSQDRTALLERRSNLMDFVISWRFDNIILIIYSYLLLIDLLFLMACVSNDRVFKKMHRKIQNLLKFIQSQSVIHRCFNFFLSVSLAISRFYISNQCLYINENAAINRDSRF